MAHIEEWNQDPEDDLIERAIRAYCTRERRAGRIVQQPAYDWSYTICPARDYLNGGDVFSVDETTYVILKNVNGVLAVYRMKDDGHIEYVAPDYWPDALVEAGHGLVETARAERTSAAEERQREAVASGVLNGYRAAKYVGVSASTFGGWAWKYKIPMVDTEGNLLPAGEKGVAYRIEDLDAAMDTRDYNIARTNPHHDYEPRTETGREQYRALRRRLSLT